MTDNDTKKKVLVSPTRSGGGRKYHTDEDCRYVTDRHGEWDLEMALAWDIEKCSTCDHRLSFLNDCIEES